MVCPGGPGRKAPQCGAFRRVSVPPSVLAALKKFRRGSVARDYCRRAVSGCFYRRIWPFERFGGSMEQENRLKITVWLKPDVVQPYGWLAQRRTTAKAAGSSQRRPCGSTWATWPQRTPQCILSRASGGHPPGASLADSDNRLRSLLFKLVRGAEHDGPHHRRPLPGRPHQPPGAAGLCRGRGAAHQRSDQLRQGTGLSSAGSRRMSLTMTYELTFDSCHHTSKAEETAPG